MDRHVARRGRRAFSGLLCGLLCAGIMPARAVEEFQPFATWGFQGAAGCPGLRFGDLNGDGKLEIVVGQPMPQPDAHTPQQVARVTAFDLKGTILWQYQAPGQTILSNHGASSDIPLQVYDWDGDGRAEVIADFSSKEMTFLDGTTGQPTRTIPLPQGRSATGPSGANDCILIANLRGTPWPQDFIVKTRYTQVWGIDGRDGKVLWTYQQSGGDNLAHFGYVFNADTDPMDEYLSGWQLLDQDGKVKWKVPGLTMHIDAASVGEVDGDTADGPEVAMASQIGVLVNARSGKELWRDNHVTADGQGIQQIAIGDFHPGRPGREVVMLERIGPRTSTGRDANILVAGDGGLIWKENRTGSDYGWVTVTERITNWDGSGKDQILSYRRTSQYPTIYSGDGTALATFPHPGSRVEFLSHADLCGDAREEVVIYNETTAWFYANGPCDLSAPARQRSLPQNRRHYNWSVYSGWDAQDYTFYTPGAVANRGLRPLPEAIRLLPSAGGMRFTGVPEGARLRLQDLAGKVIARSGSIAGGTWEWAGPKTPGVYLARLEGSRWSRRVVLP